MTTTTPKDDLPESRILPDEIYIRNDLSKYEHGELEICSFIDDDGQCYIRADLCTPAIADGSDLFICRRTVAGDNRDGATRYYVYQELRPYDGAIADGVGVDVNAAITAFEIDDNGRRRITLFVPDDYKAVIGAMVHISTPPQAATDEGV